MLELTYIRQINILLHYISGMNFLHFIIFSITTACLELLVHGVSSVGALDRVGGSVGHAGPTVLVPQHLHKTRGVKSKLWAVKPGVLHSVFLYIKGGEFLSLSYSTLF